jgi:hypothetical protein
MLPFSMLGVTGVLGSRPKTPVFCMLGPVSPHNMLNKETSSAGVGGSYELRSVSEAD